LKNLLIFDSSTKNILFGGTVKGGNLFHCINLERSKMSRQLPDFFLNIKTDITFDGEPEIIIGQGPGPFTGLKTANSFFLGFLYSLGLKNVRLVSSFRIISALTPTEGDLNKLVVIPFNRGEYFLGLLDKENNLLVKDVFIKEHTENIKDIFKDYLNSKIELILGSECGATLVETLRSHFDINSTYQEKYHFDHQRSLSLLKGEPLDITKEPFILNHVINPADIDKNCNIYVSNNFEEG
jgi:tRNA A37 threonylcarbamoyladenosine modification protein TsaB